ncbi:hypothetical protein [Streptomyces sp. NPDC059639]|uniref:hypothetical protein n=1 Tax=Streptomyces sp. NPDC059639 TaxID=3346891 RepID=UPI00367B7C0D
MTGGWLFLGAGAVRASLAWAGLAVLVGCVLAAAGQVVRSGGRMSRVESYELALASVREPGSEPSDVPALPVAVLGTCWVWIRVTSVAVAVVTAAVFTAGLGFAQPERSATAAALADAGYVIEELPIVAVANTDFAGRSSRSSTMADYTVELKSADRGRAVPATFRAYNAKGVREVGGTYVVAHAPARPDLGAIGDTSARAVEARLTGHALSYRGTVFAAVAWAIAVGLALAVATGVASRPRGARRVGCDWVALRVTVTGQAEHVEPEKAEAESAVGNGSGKSSSRYACLALRTDTGEDVPLAVSAKARAAADVLTGNEGWLLWDPQDDSRGGGKTTAEFVADDGWQLPGRVPRSVASRFAARPRGPFPVDADRRIRLLELGGLWPRTVPPGLLAGLLIATAATGALLIPLDGGWRIWTALAAILAPLLGCLLTEDAGTPVVAAVDH